MSGDQAGQSCTPTARSTNPRDSAPVYANQDCLIRVCLIGVHTVSVVMGRVDKARGRPACRSLLAALLSCLFAVAPVTAQDNEAQVDPGATPGILTPGLDSGGQLVARSLGSGEDTSPLTSPADTQAPVAGFTFRSVNSVTARRIEFDASESYDNVGIVRYAWRFGDGTYLNGSRAVSVVHAYPAGKFRVTLTVYDAAGLASSDTRIVNTESDVDSTPGGAAARGRAESSAVVDPPAVDTRQGDATGQVTLAQISGAKPDPELIPADATAPELPQPVPLKPGPDAVLGKDDSVVFSWRPLETAVLYDFRILDAASNEMVRVGEFSASSICTRNRCRLTQGIELDYAKGYNWQVRARNRRGWSAWSDSAFSVLPAGVSQPKVPLGLFPGPGATLVNDDTVVFQWEHRSQVDSYRFQLVEQQSGRILVDTRAHSRMFCDSVRCAYPRPVTLRAGGDYAWQIQARNKAGESGWFRTRFTVTESDNPVLPTAAFLYSLAGTDPMNVVFDARESTAKVPLVRFEWSFGDGIGQMVSRSGTPVSYQYTSGGSYLAELTVVDANGGRATTQKLINVGPGTVPEAHFLVDGFDRDASGSAPLIVTFDPLGSSDDGAIVDYTWDFGDGTDPVSNSVGAVVSHSYIAEGRYTVSLTVTDDSNLKAVHTRQINVQDSPEALTAADAGRFLGQSTFGPGLAEITRLTEVGYEAWLDEQFTLSGTDHVQYVSQFADGKHASARHEIWWQDVVHGKDQLRQRIAYALSQMFATANQYNMTPSAQLAATAYYDLLREHAFGNYRDLLEALVLNPLVADNTGNLRNSSTKDSRAAKTRSPQVDESFARLLLQRFTLGDVQLAADGTASAIPAYTPGDVSNIARALTGWSLHGTTEWAPETAAPDTSWTKPMQAIEAYHDREIKRLPGGEVTPPDLTAYEDLTLVLDNLFAHPNVGPFIVRQLIQKLVTDNPSSSFVERAAAVFNDNGVGVRGDLRAVIRFILLDAEARDFPRSADYGKVREPVMAIAHVWRAFGVRPGTASVHGEFSFAGVALTELDELTGQHRLNSPGVYHFEAARTAVGHSVADKNSGRASNPASARRAKSNLQAPGFVAYSAADLLATSAVLNQQVQRHYSGTPHSDDLQTAYLDFTAEITLAQDPEKLLDRLSLLLLSGAMSDDLRNVLMEHITGLPDSVSGRFRRVRDAVSLILLSPDYLVQM